MIPGRAAHAGAGIGTGAASGTEPGGRRWLWSGLLILLLVLFVTGTRWGGGFTTFAQRTWIVWSHGRGLSYEARCAAAYEPTFMTLLFLRDNTPPDAVVLLPPSEFVIGKSGRDVALLASPSSTYNFIYPRVPVHWGDDRAPMVDEVSHLLVWEHWGLHLVEPDAALTVDNRITIYGLEPGGAR